MAAFQEILDVLPGRLQTLDFSAAQELRLRVGQAPAVLENGRERRLSGLVRPGELDGILQRLLYEFPIREIAVQMPSWVMMLEPGHWLQDTAEEGAGDAGAHKGGTSKVSHSGESRGLL